MAAGGGPPMGVTDAEEPQPGIRGQRHYAPYSLLLIEGVRGLLLGICEAWTVTA